MNNNTPLEEVLEIVRREKTTVNVGTTAHAICSTIQLKIETELLERDREERLELIEKMSKDDIEVLPNVDKTKIMKSNEGVD